MRFLEEGGVASLDSHCSLGERSVPQVGRKSRAIALCCEDLAVRGYRYGPVIRAEAVGAPDAGVWEVEMAYDGQTVRCPTTDPPSIVLWVNIATGDVRLVDLM